MSDHTSQNRNNLQDFKTTLWDFNKKIIDEKIIKYHLCETPLNVLETSLNILDVDSLKTIDKSEGAKSVKIIKDNYEKSINNVFKKKLKRTSSRSLMLLNFAK